MKRTKRIFIIAIGVEIALLGGWIFLSRWALSGHSFDPAESLSRIGSVFGGAMGGLGVYFALAWYWARGKERKEEAAAREHAQQDVFR